MSVFKIMSPRVIYNGAELKTETTTVLSTSIILVWPNVFL